MANDRGLGCLGLISGLVVLVALGWMALELLLYVGSAPSGLLTDAVFQHKLGELLVVATLILGSYLAILRPPAEAAAFARLARAPLLLGAALNAVAWLSLRQGTRWGTWSLILVILGGIGPFALERTVEHLAEKERRATPPQG